jgi:hypothetical protein
MANYIASPPGRPDLLRVKARMPRSEERVPLSEARKGGDWSNDSALLRAVAQMIQGNHGRVEHYLQIPLTSNGPYILTQRLPGTISANLIRCRRRTGVTTPRFIKCIWPFPSILWKASN